MPLHMTRVSGIRHLGFSASVARSNLKVNAPGVKLSPVLETGYDVLLLPGRVGNYDLNCAQGCHE